MEAYGWFNQIAHMYKYDNKQINDFVNTNSNTGFYYFEHFIWDNYCQKMDAIQKSKK